MRKLPLLTTFGIVVAVILAVVIGGPMVYSTVAPKQADPFSLTEASGSAPRATPRPTDADNGTWAVQAGSQAGYRVEEVLNGKPTTVLGRTDRVTGSATVKDAQLIATTVTVEAGSIATDNPGRDNYFRFTVISAGKYPQATFTLGAPVALPAIGERPVDVQVPGALALAGEQHAVTANLKVVRSGDGIVAAGTVPIAVKDFGIDPPNLGFVKVEDQGTVEFRVNLAQG